MSASLLGWLFLFFSLARRKLLPSRSLTFLLAEAVGLLLLLKIRFSCDPLSRSSSSFSDYLLIAFP